MLNVPRRMLNSPQRPPNTSRSHAFAGWLVLAASGMVLLGGILTHSDLAQTAALFQHRCFF
jgi:hypothetical protein